MQAGWDNHFSAFGEQDLEKSMLEASGGLCQQRVGIRRRHNIGDIVVQGTDQIRKMLAWLLKELPDKSTLKGPVIEEEKDARQVFLR